jgi:hypothetical protein
VSCALLAGFLAFFEGSVGAGINAPQNGRDATALRTARGGAAEGVGSVISKRVAADDADTGRDDHSVEAVRH